MTLDRDSAVVRWAYPLETPPEGTTLCALFWRVVLWTPLKIVGPTFLALGVPSALFLLGMLAPEVIVLALIVPLFVVAVAGIGVGIDMFRDRPSVIKDGFYAMRSTVCPIVWIKGK